VSQLQHAAEVISLRFGSPCMTKNQSLLNIEILSVKRTLHGITR